MSSTCKFKVGDIVTHIGGRGNTGKVTRVTTDTITVVFEDRSKDYNYNSNTRSLQLVKEKTVHKYPIYKKSKTNGVVVHFTALESGFVTERGDTLLDIGCYSSSWTPHTSDDQWEDYTPEPRTKHICEVLEEKVNLETAIKFAKNYTEWVSSKNHYSDSIKNAASLINSFNWTKSKEGYTFWSKIHASVTGIKATATYSTFIKYANMALPEEVEEIKEQEATYPIYKKSKSSGMVVKFTGLEDGVVVEAGDGVYQEGYKSIWKPHTDTSIWEHCRFTVIKTKDIKLKEPKTKPIQIKTESTIMTKLKTTATSVATQNKDAIKVAAKLEAGKIINKQVIKQVKPHLPLLVRGLADHPAASIVLANVVSIAVKHFMPENKKLNAVAELMLGAAAVDTVASFNIETFVEDLLKNIKLPTGALDDDN